MLLLFNKFGTGCILDKNRKVLVVRVVQIEQCRQVRVVLSQKGIFYFLITSECFMKSSVVTCILSIILFQSLKECSSQYPVLIKMHIVKGKEKLCEIYFKKLFFQNVLDFIDLFNRYHYPCISSTQIAYDLMCVQHVLFNNFYIVYRKIFFFSIKGFFLLTMVFIRKK